MAETSASLSLRIISGTILPIVIGFSLETIGIPSKKMIRAISPSAWCISSIARFSITWWRRSYPQLAHISEWTMYWLMAVSSSARSWLSTSMTFGSPFIVVLLAVWMGDRRFQYKPGSEACDSSHDDSLFFSYQGNKAHASQALRYVPSLSGSCDPPQFLVVAHRADRDHQDAADLQLVEKGRGDMIRCRGDDNAVKGRRLWPTAVAIGVPHVDSGVPEALEPGPSRLG